MSPAQRHSFPSFFLHGTHNMNLVISSYGEYYIKLTTLGLWRGLVTEFKSNSTMHHT